jgi:hypothetical protein
LIGLVVSLTLGPQVGIIAGGLIGPLAAMLLPLGDAPDEDQTVPLAGSRPLGADPGRDGLP